MQRAIFLLFACSAAIGLAADGPEFEVASVKPSAPLTGGAIRIGSSGGPGTSDPGQVRYTGLTLKNLLTTAYGVKIYQISGPGWLDTERYDIIAKMPPETTKAEFALMLQNLLAERFKLTLHHETKDLPLYELVVAKNGPKLKPWVEDPNATAPPGAVMMSASRTSGVQRMRMTATKQSISTMADMLANQLGRGVIDKTGLTGEYDYSLEFSTEGLARGGLAGLPPPPPGVGGLPPENPPSDQESPSLLTAVQEQLGLRLESKKGPLDLLVIDHADKTPTEN